MSTTLQITGLPENVATVLERRAAEGGVTVSEYVCALLVRDTAEQTASEVVAELVEVSRSAGFPISAEEAWTKVRETRV